MSAIINQCCLCKNHFTTETMEEHGGKMYCENCLKGIRESFKYYIGRKEVTFEDYKKFIKGK